MKITVFCCVTLHFGAISWIGNYIFVNPSKKRDYHATVSYAIQEESWANVMFLIQQDVIFYVHLH
jgi:hypothetical protein